MIDFHNPASKSGTGGQRIRVEPAAAWSDIRELKGVPGGFARIWNYEGEALSIHSQPGSLLRVALGDTIADRDPEHVVDLAMSFVSKGSASLNDRRSRPMPAPTEADSQ